MRGEDRRTPSGSYSVTHTHTHTHTRGVEYRWYSQSLSVAGDIPWHGSETQSVAVHCGATAGTQGWAGAGIAHEQSREHHHPHPEWLPGQPAHACTRTATSNGHIHHHCSQLLLLLLLLLLLNFCLCPPLSPKSPAAPRKSSRIILYICGEYK